MQAARVMMACVVFLTMCAAAAGDEPAPLVPLIRFYHTKQFYHVYTYRQDELAAWRKAPEWAEQKVVGYISTQPAPGTQRLWRAVRPDGRHYYYVEAPKQAKNVHVESTRFVAYVWKQRSQGRVPVYANSWTDGTDMYLDPDKKAVDKYAENTKKALGVTRPDFGLVFYIHEQPPEEKPAQAEQ